jgi:hypothetical protein
MAIIDSVGIWALGSKHPILMGQTRLLPLLPKRPIPSSSLTSAGEGTCLNSIHLSRIISSLGQSLQIDMLEPLINAKEIKRGENRI